MSNFLNRRYVIITTAEIDSLPIDFSQVLESSASTLRYSLDNTKTFVKYSGSQPSFLSGKTEYTHSEILAELAGNDWTFTVGTIDLSALATTATLNETKTNQTATVSGASSVALPVYSWSATDSNGDDAGASVVFSASNAATTNITYAASGTFTVKLTLTDSNYSSSETMAEASISVVVS
jgi:hypothetical protein